MDLSLRRESKERIMFRKIIFIAVLVTLPISQVLAASEFGTKEEAMALVQKAESLLKSAGKDKAIADLNANPTGFVDRDLYITLADEQGVRIYHGQNPKLVGKSIAEAVDVNGKAYGKEMMEVAKSPEGGWIDYSFKDPITKKVLEKTSYVKNVDGVIIVCGVYKR
jgi:cytochrome c